LIVLLVFFKKKYLKSVPREHIAKTVISAQMLRKFICTSLR